MKEKHQNLFGITSFNNNAFISINLSMSSITTAKLNRGLERNCVLEIITVKQNKIRMKYIEIGLKAKHHFI